MGKGRLKLSLFKMLWELYDSELERDFIFQIFYCTVMKLPNSYADKNKWLITLIKYFFLKMKDCLQFHKFSINVDTQLDVSDGMLYHNQIICSALSFFIQLNISGIGHNNVTNLIKQEMGQEQSLGSISIPNENSCHESFFL